MKLVSECGLSLSLSLALSLGSFIFVAVARVILPLTIPPPPPARFFSSFLYKNCLITLISPILLHTLSLPSIPTYLWPRYSYINLYRFSILTLHTTSSSSIFFAPDKSHKNQKTPFISSLEKMCITMSAIRIMPLRVCMSMDAQAHTGYWAKEFVSLFPSLCRTSGDFSQLQRTSSTQVFNTVKPRDLLLLRLLFFNLHK